MNRISRTVSAVALSAALLIATASATQARPLQGHQTAKPAVSWLDAALAWLSDFVVGPAQQGQTQQSPATKVYTTTGTSGSGGFGGATTMCGSIIDPNGGCSTTGG